MNYEDQAKQLALNAQRIAAANKAACASIDRFHAKIKHGSGSSAGKKYAAPTIHDLAQENPLIMRLIRKSQGD